MVLSTGHHAGNTFGGRTEFDAVRLRPPLPMRSLPARTHLVREGEEVSVRLLQSGWACGTRLFADGRRQVLRLILPGDLLCDPAHLGTEACYGVVALTPVTMVQLSVAAIEPDELRRARMRAEWHLLNQITRLGRLSAYERIAHLLLELRDRMRVAGLCVGERFDLPLTQELLADVLGLTSVHINRTLQQMRRDGVIELGGRSVTLCDAASLARVAEYRPMPAMGHA